jgi:hypothetical protein
LGTGTTITNVGHNVTDTGVTDADLTTPPGDENATGVTNLNLTCAGTLGCHVNRATAGVGASMKGAHHTNDAVLKFGVLLLLLPRGQQLAIATGSFWASKALKTQTGRHQPPLQTIMSTGAQQPKAQKAQ